MNPISLFSCGQNTLVHPSLRIGLALTDRKTGSSLMEKNLSLSGSGTVLECLGALLALLLSLRLLCLLFRMRRSLRQKMGKMRPKRRKIMSES